MTEVFYKVAYPVAFHTVDVALVAFDGEEFYVAMIQKKSEVSSGMFRFPGGFVDPGDSSAEEAAVRELQEEIGCVVSKKDLVYIGSSKIDDPRYAESSHKIITSFYMHYTHEKIRPVAGDDAAVVKMIKLSDLDKKINPIHRPLLDMLLASEFRAYSLNQS
jgi:bifunctional NMN adenylyltransferase/nudix hydrolase